MEEINANREATNEVNILPETAERALNRIRIAVALFYFGQGIAFASWASRIPDIKNSLRLSDGELGSILLALPAGQLFTMIISGRLVTRFGSKKVLTITAPLYVLALTNLGLAAAPWHLAVFLFIFGIVGNMCNISVNTQGAEAEKMFGRSIMTSFHGAWSIAGFTGALIGLLMVNLHITPYSHFWIVSFLIFINVALNHNHLVPGKGAVTVRTKKFVMPEWNLIQLGIIGFCSMATEGAMFDWSGVYFKDIVHAPRSLVILGYASFMIMMATGRFIGDKIIGKLGRRTTIKISGLIISAGMFTSVFFPFVITATIGFMLVGIGVSSIVPTVYSVAGKNGKVAPGIAIAIVSSVSYFGFLLGPPLIGGISELSSLQYSYAVIGCFGLLVSFLVTKIKAIE
ncbi:MFS transporter [Pedobacter endophyticus]|uniref:MFS transporter n=1 Tax=Pedobacter endophyticus TaxID=2789740 RepID=A0A7S9L333_9SPHI|nr:MFS transporter [Pedobacter endophyticus]QPH41582.1 MFS transporter [Pedobacter endophyticus]